MLLECEFPRGEKEKQIEPNSCGQMDAENFCITLHTNVNNALVSDKAFRQFVRSTLPIVHYERPAFFAVYTNGSLKKTKGVWRLLTKEYPAVTFGLSALDNQGLVWVRDGLLTAEGLAVVQAKAVKFSRRVRG